MGKTQVHQMLIVVEAILWIISMDDVTYHIRLSHDTQAADMPISWTIQWAECLNKDLTTTEAYFILWAVPESQRQVVVVVDSPVRLSERSIIGYWLDSRDERGKHEAGRKKFHCRDQPMVSRDWAPRSIVESFVWCVLNHSVTECSVLTSVRTLHIKLSSVNLNFLLCNLKWKKLFAFPSVYRDIGSWLSRVLLPNNKKLLWNRFFKFTSHPSDFYQSSKGVSGVVLIAVRLTFVCSNTIFCTSFFLKSNHDS